MLQFKVFDDIGTRACFELKGAHLLLRDDVAIRGEVTLRDSPSLSGGSAGGSGGRLIRCRRRGTDPVALAIVHDAGRMGRLMLHTTLLPDREEPYLLALELARQRIKQFIAKSEEWQMFDLAPEHSAMRLWEEARHHFTLAINDLDPVAADGHAKRSLEAGVDASERLALAHAEILLHRRFGMRAASSTTLGIGVHPGRFDPPQQQLISKEADVVVVPLTWRELQVGEKRYDWDRTDRLMAWAHGQNKPIVTGPLLEFTTRAMPPWMEVWKHDFDTCRDLVYDHVAKVVERYRGVVGIWNLAAGLNVNPIFPFTSEQTIALLRTAGVLVRQLRRGGRTMVEVSHPFGEHTAFNRDSISPIAWLDQVVQEGLQLDCIGVRVHFGGTTPDLAARDLMQVSAILDRLLPFETPVMLTGLAVPSMPPDDPTSSQTSWWHSGWSERTQARWISKLVSIALSKPFVEAVFWGDLLDRPELEVQSGGLISQSGEAKAALAALVTARRRLRKPIGLLKVAARSTLLGDEE